MEPIDLNQDNYEGVRTTTSDGDYDPMARASLVLGILSLIPIFYIGISFVFGLLALIFGIIGKKNGNEQDKKQATAGIICGVIGIIISIIIIMLIITAISIVMQAVGGMIEGVSSLVDVPSLIESYQSGDINEIIETIKNLDLEQISALT